MAEAAAAPLAAAAEEALAVAAAASRAGWMAEHGLTKVPQGVEGAEEGGLGGGGATKKTGLSAEGRGGSGAGAQGLDDKIFAARARTLQ